MRVERDLMTVRNQTIVEGTGYVKWIQILPILMAMMTAQMAFVWSVFENHEKNPHMGAASTREIDILLDAVKENKRQIMENNRQIMLIGKKIP